MGTRYREMMEDARANGGLLDALHAAQNADGYVTEDAMREAADVFGMTPAAVYDTVSFYTMLRLSPACAHEVRICGGAPCGVDGSESVLKAVEQYLGIRAGESKEDRSCDLRRMACQGHCGEGPVLMIDGTLYTNVTADQVVDLLKRGGV